MILPSQYGLIAMLSIFVAISQALINSGLSSAIIRKTNRTDTDCSTIFFYNVFVAGVVYLLLYITAPNIAQFYSVEELCLVLRIMSISIIISALSSIHNTLFAADLSFKTLSIINLISVCMAGIVAIIIALKGFQVWALVIQSILQSLISTIALWIKSTWKPTLKFSFYSLKESFSFGSKLMASSVINSVFNHIYAATIGKFWQPALLGFYSKADNITTLSVQAPTDIISTISYPAMCKMQHDTEKLRQNYRLMIKLAAFVLFPLCLCIGAVAYPLITVLLTDLWLDTAPILQILVFSLMWYPIHALNLNILKVKGRSDIFLNLEIGKKMISIILLITTIPLGITAICYGRIVTSIVSLALNTIYTGKELRFGFFAQLRDIAPSLLLSIAMFVCGYIVAGYAGNNIVGLISGILTCLFVYLFGAILFRFSELQELKKIAINAIKR